MWIHHLPSRELTYPTLGEKEKHLQNPIFGDMLVPWRVPIACSFISELSHSHSSTTKNGPRRASPSITAPLTVSALRLSTSTFSACRGNGSSANTSSRALPVCFPLSRLVQTERCSQNEDVRWCWQKTNPRWWFYNPFVNHMPKSNWVFGVKIQNQNSPTLPPTIMVEWKTGVSPMVPFLSFRFI